MSVREKNPPAPDAIWGVSDYGIIPKLDCYLLKPPAFLIGGNDGDVLMLLAAVG